MKKKLMQMAVTVVVTLALTLPALADSTDSNRYAMWLNGNVTSKGKPGYGFGFKGRNFGVEVSYSASGDYDSDQVWVLPQGLEKKLGASSLVGEKNIDGSLGIDFMLINNPTDTLSIFGEGGLFYQETQIVYRVNTSSQFSDAGQLWSFEHKYKAKFGGGGGLMLRIPTSEFFSFNGFHLQGGYHSLRGVTFALGLTY